MERSDLEGDSLFFAFLLCCGFFLSSCWLLAGLKSKTDTRYREAQKQATLPNKTDTWYREAQKQAAFTSCTLHVCGELSDCSKWLKVKPTLALSFNFLKCILLSLTLSAVCSKRIQYSIIFWGYPVLWEPQRAKLSKHWLGVWFYISSDGVLSTCDNHTAKVFGILFSIFNTMTIKIKILHTAHINIYWKNNNAFM